MSCILTKIRKHCKITTQVYQINYMTACSFALCISSSPQALSLPPSWQKKAWHLIFLNKSILWVKTISTKQIYKNIRYDTFPSTETASSIQLVLQKNKQDGGSVHKVGYHNVSDLKSDLLFLKYILLLLKPLDNPLICFVPDHSLTFYFP